MKKKEVLDELFKAGLTSDDVQVPYDEQNWQKLEQRLLRYHGRKRVVFWLRMGGSIAAILLLAFVLWTLVPRQQSPVITELEAEQTVLPEDSVAGKVVSIARQIAQESGSVGSDTGSEGMYVEVKQQPVVPLFGKVDKTISRESGQGGLEPISPKEALFAAKTAFLPLIQMNPKEETVVVPAEPLAENRFELRPADDDKKRGGKMALSILAAPAYNGVNNLNNAKVGVDAGLLFSVQVLKNLRLSTGAVYAVKYYETDFDNYNPLQSTGYYKPQSVDADCRVLDIPLNIDYTILNKRNLSMSLGTGISSYIMLRETYKYDYNYASNSAPDGVQIVNGSQHWMSILNLQGNIERKLTPRLSLSLRPYMKIPLNEVGYGRIKLESFGVAFSTNWAF